MTTYTTKSEEGLRTWDGGYIPWEEIERFYEEVVPEQYPGVFEVRFDPNSRAIKKEIYLLCTLPDRLRDAQAKGKAIVGRWGASNPTDQYYAAGLVPMSSFGFCTREMVFRKDPTLTRFGRSQLSEDACPYQATMHGAVATGVLPMDVGFPYVGSWCFESPVNLEQIRNRKPDLEVRFFDQPMFCRWPGKEEHTLEYLMHEMRTSIISMGEMLGKQITAEDVRAEIKRENRCRVLLGELFGYQSIQPPPMSAAEVLWYAGMTVDWLADPDAACGVLETAVEEVRERVRKGERGYGVCEDPIRLVISGLPSADLALLNIIEDMGAAVVGFESMWNITAIDEEGDPFEALARRATNIPLSLPARQRAYMVSKQSMERYRPDGTIYCNNFGCHLTSAPGPILMKIYEHEFGIPCLALEIDLPGGGHGQMSTRIQAFIETIRNRKEKAAGA